MLVVAHDLWASGENFVSACPRDEIHLAIQKRSLLKKFRNCQKKHSVHSISLFSGIPGLNVEVWNGESGLEERDACLVEFKSELDELNRCIENNFPEKNLLSREEFAGYTLAMGNFSAYWSAIEYYKDESEKYKPENLVDRYNTADEEYLFSLVSEASFNAVISNMEGDREDKDMAILYLQYLKIKYDFAYYRSHASVNGLEWIEFQKKNYLEKYPGTRHRDFILNEMNNGLLTREEKQAAKAFNREVKTAIDIETGTEEVRQKLAKKPVWVSLSAFSLFGIPVTYTEGFDENFDVSTTLSFGIKAQYRFLVAQYQYYMSLGDNTMGKVFSENGYAIMGGISAGLYKRWSVDFLMGWTWIDTHPNTESLKHSDIDDESVFLALQTSVFFPVAESWDVFAHVQASLHFVENYCREEYLTREEWGNGYVMHYCRDPYRQSDNSNYWDDLQWTFSVGVGIRFWKPKPKSLYPEKYTRNL